MKIDCRALDESIKSASRVPPRLHSLFSEKSTSNWVYFGNFNGRLLVYNWTQEDNAQLQIEPERYPMSPLEREDSFDNF